MAVSVEYRTQVGVPRPRVARSITLGGGNATSIQRALLAELAKYAAPGANRELLRRDVLNYGHCLLTDAGLRVDPRRPEGAALCITYAITRGAH